MDALSSSMRIVAIHSLGGANVSEVYLQRVTQPGNTLLSSSNTKELDRMVIHVCTDEYALIVGDVLRVCMSVHTAAQSKGTPMSKDAEYAMMCETLYSIMETNRCIAASAGGLLLSAAMNEHAWNACGTDARRWPGKVHVKVELTREKTLGVTQ